MRLYGEVWNYAASVHFACASRSTLNLCTLAPEVWSCAPQWNVVQKLGTSKCLISLNNYDIQTGKRDVDSIMKIIFSNWLKVVIIVTKNGTEYPYMEYM